MRSPGCPGKFWAPGEVDGPTNLCDILTHFGIFDPLRVKISTPPPLCFRIYYIFHKFINLKNFKIPILLRVNRKILLFWEILTLIQHVFGFYLWKTFIIFQLEVISFQFLYKNNTFIWKRKYKKFGEIYSNGEICIFFLANKKWTNGHKLEPFFLEIYKSYSNVSMRCNRPKILFQKNGIYT